MSTKTDFMVENHGTIFLLTPRTKRAQDWINDNIAGDRQMWGKSVVIEHRYIQDIVVGARNDGLTVE